MKKIVIGIIIGIVICVAVGFGVMPGMKKAAYDNGYAEGNKAGIATGTTAGIAKGVADVQAMQKHTTDSTANAQKVVAEIAMKKAAHSRKKVVKEVQNWHVINGKIQEPITE